MGEVELLIDQQREHIVDGGTLYIGIGPETNLLRNLFLIIDAYFRLGEVK